MLKKPSKKGGNSSDDFEHLEIPSGALWGAQTQLSLQYFKIGQHCFSLSFITALIHIKRACAQINHDEGLLNDRKYEAIIYACDELLAGHHSNQFPLRIWQTGSGTQTNMNVNEVISSLANNYLNKSTYKESSVHPNDHVNMSQSSNDVFPTAMHISAVHAIQTALLKSIELLDVEFFDKQKEFAKVSTVGRTHLMDALPLTVGDEFSSYRAQLADAQTSIMAALTNVYRLAIGGTAVGTGCNAPEEFGQKVSSLLSSKYALPFKSHSNLFAAVSGEDALLKLSAALKQLASFLFKLANDFRLLGSGPRCGLNEWQLPANEPGSSIMPGKVNPTQCEALSMVCLQVFGNDLTVSLAASQGQLQLNAYRPVIIHNVLESIELLSGAITSFSVHCVSGLKLNHRQLAENLSRNLSSITTLGPKLGYELAAKIVHTAYSSDLSLGEAAEELGVYSCIEFEELLQKSFIKE